MSGSLDTLIRMANQIAANLAHEHDPAAATAEHIRSFWDSRMRTMILSAAPERLSPSARTAVESLPPP